MTEKGKDGVKTRKESTGRPSLGVVPWNISVTPEQKMFGESNGGSSFVRSLLEKAMSEEKAK